jgi:hypothetical protein
MCLSYLNLIQYAVDILKYNLLRVENVDPNNLDDE